MPKQAAAPSGGDGAAVVDTAGEAATNLPDLVDASKTEAELADHITEVLGLPVDKVEDKSDGAAIQDAGAGGTATGDKGAGEAAKTDVDAGKSKVVPPVEPVAKIEAAPIVASPLELKVTDAKGVEFTLKPGDDIDVALKDFEPSGTGQVMKVIGQFQELNVKAEQAKTDAQTAAQKAEAEAEFKSIQASWDGEITALQTAERIGKPAVAITDPAYKDDPVAKRVDAVFQFMATENQARQAAAKAAGTAYLPIRSFTDALDKLELQEMRAGQAKAKNTDLEIAKQKSAAIGGGAGSGAGSVEKPYVPGSAKSIWDV